MNHRSCAVLGHMIEAQKQAYVYADKKNAANASGD